MENNNCACCKRQISSPNDCLTCCWTNGNKSCDVKCHVSCDDLQQPRNRKKHWKCPDHRICHSCNTVSGVWKDDNWDPSYTYCSSCWLKVVNGSSCDVCGKVVDETDDNSFFRCTGCKGNFHFTCDQTMTPSPLCPICLKLASPYPYPFTKLPLIYRKRNALRPTEATSQLASHSEAEEDTYKNSLHITSPSESNMSSKQHTSVQSADILESSPTHSPLNNTQTQTPPSVKQTSNTSTKLVAAMPRTARLQRLPQNCNSRQLKIHFKTYSAVFKKISSKTAEIDSLIKTLEAKSDLTQGDVSSLQNSLCELLELARFEE